MWFKIENRADRTIVRLSGEIGIEVSASQLVAQLDATGNAPVELRINSIGGSVSDGFAIYNALLGRNVDVLIEGFAASMASIIAMAGKTVRMHATGLFMIHNPATGAFGDAGDHRKIADTLDQVRDMAVMAYQRHTSASAKQVIAWMDAETWFTADEAMNAGFVDEVIRNDLVDMAACARDFKLDRFTNVPAGFKESAMEKTFTDGVAAERERVAAITTTFRKYPGQEVLMAKCIADGIPVAAANERLLAKLGEGAEPIYLNAGYEGRLRSDDFIMAASDALCKRYGVPVEKVHPGARDLARMSLLDMAEVSLRRVGVATQGLSKMKLAQVAFSHTSSDFPALLENLATKALMAGYKGEANTAEGWTSIEDVPDFKIQSRVQLSEAPNLELVPEAGEITAGTFNESKEQYQIYTYARIFSISRQALINDDLQSFTRIPQAFGQAARRKELDLVFGILTGNPTMADSVALFHANHGNLAGSGAALSVTSLGAARAAMRKQKGISGLQVLNVVPRFLIVPAALETLAEQLLGSLVDPTKSNMTPNLEFIRGLDLVVDARLDVSSATAWYLASSPTQMDTIARGYLDGQQSVFIETESGFVVDGAAWKARLDFGCKALNWRGLYKNPGA